MEVAQLIRMLLHLYSATGINEKFETRIICVFWKIYVLIYTSILNGMFYKQIYKKKYFIKFFNMENDLYST